MICAILYHKVKIYQVFKHFYGVGMVTQMVNVPVAKPDNLTSILGSHMVKGENRFLHVIL